MNAEKVAGIFWLAFSSLVMFGSYQMGLGSLQAPGSGFLAFLAGAFVFLMALIVLVQTFISKDQQSKLGALWSESKWRKSMMVGLLILAYILALERLGFLLTSLMMMFVMFKWVEKFSWKKASLVTVIVVGCAYLLFSVLLKASLPRGLLDF
ncbi:MAG: tripartite tricarboxylate transporter TctB family protein [Deltaproteobacteria bacterium]|nr:tripartite tricarboxylate transporter TctB family protein [Deltaproteobacteria bacterium]